MSKTTGQLMIRDQGIVIDQRRVLMVIGVIGAPADIADRYKETLQYPFYGRFSDESLTLCQMSSGSWPKDTPTSLSADQMLTYPIWRI